MLVYRATEKDCVGEDGGEQECVICFEEFKVGDEMGRLECLCKFHKVSSLSQTLILAVLLMLTERIRIVSSNGGIQRGLVRVQPINFMNSIGPQRALLQHSYLVLIFLPAVS